MNEWEGGDPDCKHEGKPLGRGEHRTVEGAWDRPNRLAVPRQPVCMHCGATEIKVDGGIGLEPTFEEHVENLMQVFDEVWRVLRDDGTVFLNYGDRYENKQLMQMPADVARAMKSRGWILRSEIVWAKSNPMPESVKDRPTSAHEKVFMFSKKPKYFYDSYAVRNQSKDPKDDLRRMTYKTDDDPENRKRYPTDEVNGIRNRSGSDYMTGTANMRNVLHLATESFKGAHFATFPTKLVEPFIKAGTSEKGVCSKCGAPYKRIVEVKGGSGESWHDHSDDLGRGQSASKLPGDYSVETKGWQPTCECNGDLRPAKILDPFGGSGTVSVVAERLGRDSVICEISREYANIAFGRISNENLPLFPSSIIIIIHEEG